MNEIAAFISLITLCCFIKRQFELTLDEVI